MSTRKALATGTIALLLAGVVTSCSSARAPEPPRNTWVKLAGPADSGGASYDARILAQKWRELEALRSEVRELDAHIASSISNFPQILRAAFLKNLFSSIM